MDARYVHIGTVRSVNPARREVYVDPKRGREKTFEDMEWAEFALGRGETMRCKCAGVAVRLAEIMIRLAPGVTRDNVARLKGAKVLMPKGSAPERPEFEFAPDDVEGMAVVAEDGSAIGVVAGLIDTPAHPVLEIELTEGGGILLPAIPETIALIDLEKNRLVVFDMAPYMVHDNGPEEGPGRGTVA